jgi:hypothetical protein
MTAGPTVESVEEPSICKYVLQVCVPALCELSIPSVTTPSSDATDGHVLEAGLGTTAQQQPEEPEDAEASSYDATSSRGDAAAAVQPGAVIPPPMFYGLLWGAVLDEGNSIARDLLSPGPYSTGTSHVRFA